MSVNLSTINESQVSSRERNTPQVQLGDVGFGTKEPNKGERKYVIYKLVKKRKGRVYIDGICDNVPNPKNNNKRERVWLLNGANSIWSSELTEQLKDKEWLSRNRRSLEFEDGICRLHVDDITAIEFADVNKNNVGKQRTGSGKWDFYKYDAAEEAKAKLEREDKEIAMMLEAKQMSPEKAKKLAAFLGVSFTDDDGFPIGDDGIKMGLIRKAKQDPYKFEQYIDSEEVTVAWLVKRAIIDAKIDLTGQSGNALWAGGKGFIAKIPADRKPYEYLTELAMTNSDEGRKFLEQLKTMVE